jgi:nucleoside-diphosphate-sugar epimerase
MNVVVIGATGMVGPGIVRGLLRRGHTVTAVHRGITPYAFDSAVHVVNADRESPQFESVIRRERPDALIDLCCFERSHVDTLLRFVPRGIRVLILSTVLVHGGDGARPIREISSLRAVTDYASGKMDVEQATLDAHRRGLVCASIVRLGACYREGMYLDGQLFEDLYWLDASQAGKATVLADDGCAVWSVMHADDAGNAIARLLETDASVGETVLVASRQSVTWLNYYRLLHAALGIPLNTTFVEGDWLIDRLGKDSFLAEMSRWDQLYDLGKLESLIGNYVEEVDLSAGLSRTAMQLVRGGASGDPDLVSRAVRLIEEWDGARRVNARL